MSLFFILHSINFVGALVNHQVNQSVFPHTSSVFPHTSSLIPHTSSLLHNTSYLLPHTSPISSPSHLISYPSHLISYPSHLISYPSPLFSYPSPSPCIPKSVFCQLENCYWENYAIFRWKNNLKQRQPTRNQGCLKAKNQAENLLKWREKEIGESKNLELTNTGREKIIGPTHPVKCVKKYWSSFQT